MNHDFIKSITEALSDESKWVLFDDLQYQPEAKLYQLIRQWEHDVMRPRLQKLKEQGKDHTTDATWQFFSGIKNALFQAAEAHYIIDRLRTDLQSMKQLNEFLLHENAKLTTRLTCYESIEQLTTTGVLEMAIGRVREKMKTEYQNTHSVTKQTT